MTKAFMYNCFNKAFLRKFEGKGWKQQLEKP